jgi:hypothetical protein
VPAALVIGGRQLKVDFIWEFDSSGTEMSMGAKEPSAVAGSSSKRSKTEKKVAGGAEFGGSLGVAKRGNILNKSGEKKERTFLLLLGCFLLVTVIRQRFITG